MSLQFKEMTKEDLISMVSNPRIKANLENLKDYEIDYALDKVAEKLWEEFANYTDDYIDSSGMV